MSDNISYKRALEIGKAGEHIVCADLILSGYRAFLSDQGLPYDVLVDIDGRVLRLQVKSTLVAKNISALGKAERVAYSFNVRRRGKEGSRRLANDECDIVALVALDLRIVAYLPLSFCGQTVQMLSPSSPLVKRYSNAGWSLPIDQYSFDAALERLDETPLKYANGRKATSATACPHGHPYDFENTYIHKRSGAPMCRICARNNSRRQRLRRCLNTGLLPV